MKKILPFLSVMGVFLLTGCGLSAVTQNNSSPIQDSSANAVITSTPTPTPTPTPVTKPAETKTVTIQNFSFNPTTLTIKKGDTVIWVNNDSYDHQIKSSIFNSSKLSKGQSFSYTFNSAGTFDYLCTIHPSMTGKIIVE